MTVPIEAWKHVFKLDPERELSEEALDRICTSGTDAILVGGSSGVTYDNTVDLLSRIRRYAVPCALEISSDEAMVPGFDYYLVPSVLNTERGEWITGRHQAALKEAGSLLDWGAVAAEGYIILNEDCEAARVTGASPPATLQDLLAYARLADRLFRLPIVYMEYSGSYGNMEWVRRVKETLTQSRLFYGGGIDSVERAQAAARAAHTVVVGNALYERLNEALMTVEAVRQNIDWSDKT